MYASYEYVNPAATNYSFTRRREIGRQTKRQTQKETDKKETDIKNRQLLESQLDYKQA